MGGLDPATDADWTDDGSVILAKENCEIIVHIACGVKPGSEAACKSYLAAADLRNYQMMFIDVFDSIDFKTNYYAMNVKKANTEFQDNPQKFIDNRGTDWFFCRCKPTRKKECLGTVKLKIYRIYLEII